MSASGHDHDAWGPGDEGPDFRDVSGASLPKSQPPGSEPPDAAKEPDDDGIMEFGDVSEAAPETSLRPDQNKHYLVVPVGQPRDDDLPIYVDLDALKDMEQHALSDQTVELGGVMLGGQYLDEQQQPFVVITDSLRAKHYESTKGSFKFTHETWEQITRERDSFPEELQMVGWYHTHPDWGVFLSGMDMFICDHFFNRPLDVALVIDPCRDDRGMFQWTPGLADRVRRTGGFYLMASRFREAELTEFAEVLEGRSMARDPRYASTGASPAPVIHLSDNRAASQNLLVGMLGAQFLLLMLLAWRLLGPAGAVADNDAEKPKEDPVAAIEQKLDELTATRAAAEQTQTQLRVMDRVLSQLGDTSPGFMQQLAAREAEVDQLEASIRGHRAYQKDLEQRLGAFDERLKRAETEFEADKKALVKKYDDLAFSFKRLKEQHDELKVENTSYRKQLGIEDEDEDADDADSLWDRYRWTIVLSATFVILILAAVFASMSGRRPEEEAPEDLGPEPEGDDPPPPSPRV